MAMLELTLSSELRPPPYTTVPAHTPGSNFFSKTKGISRHGPLSTPLPSEGRHVIPVTSDRSGTFMGKTTAALSYLKVAGERSSGLRREKVRGLVERREEEAMLHSELPN